MTGYELYKIAKKHIGEGGAKARAYCHMSGGAWCNAYVCYIFGQGKVSKLFYGGKIVTYCPTSIKWCEANLAQIPLYLAMPMDVIYFDWQPNGRPDHIGFVKARKSSSEIFTHEGNTSGGRVAEKTRPAKYVQGVFRPHFTPSTKQTKSKLTIDGAFEYHSIYMFQIALGVTADAVLGKNTVKAWQRLIGVPADGAWGRKTTLASQKFLKVRQDGAWGKDSTMALQRWINNKVFPSTSVKKPTATKPTTTTKPTPKPAPKPTTTAKIKSYRVDIDLTNQIATVYGIYTDGKTKPIMSEWVSTAGKGHTTPTGSFKIQGASGGRKAKYRTAKMSSGKAYAEYLCRFHGGKCMHGVPYKTRNTKGYVYKGEFNKLGTPRSAGCVRMPIKLARYIYNNCPVGTPVKVFKGKKGVYPMGKPKKYTATSNLDPTK